MKSFFFFLFILSWSSELYAQKLLYSYNDIQNKPVDTTLYDIKVCSFIKESEQIKLTYKNGNKIKIKPDSTLWGFMDNTGAVYRAVIISVPGHKSRIFYHHVISGPILLYTSEWGKGVFRRGKAYLQFSKTPNSELHPFNLPALYKVYADNECFTNKLKQAKFPIFSDYMKTIMELYKSCEKKGT